MVGGWCRGGGGPSIEAHLGGVVQNLVADHLHEAGVRTRGERTHLQLGPMLMNPGNEH